MAAWRAPAAARPAAHRRPSLLPVSPAVPAHLDRPADYRNKDEEPDGSCLTRIRAHDLQQPLHWRLPPSECPCKSAIGRCPISLESVSPVARDPSAKTGLPSHPPGP